MTLILNDPLVALQKSMFSALSGDVTLQALAHNAAGVEVFDRVSNANFPYIVIGEDNELPDDLDCGTLSEIDATVRVYSREVGKLEAKAIAGRVRWLLDRAHGFSVPGFDLVTGVCERINIHTHTDGLTTQAELNFTYRAFALDPNLGASGAGNFARLVGAGQGRLIIEGVAASSFAALSGSGLALVGSSLNGVGSAAFARMGGSGAASLVLGAIGSGTFSRLGASGQATIGDGVIGIGSAAFARVATSGVGGLIVDATGSSVFARIGASGQATIGSGIVGIGAAAFGGLTGNGFGGLIIDGVGASAFAPLGGAAVGGLAIEAVGSAGFSRLSGTGQANIQTGLVGIGSASLARLTGSAIAALNIEGQAAGTFNRLVGSGAGALAIQGQAAASFVRLIGTGVGALGVAVDPNLLNHWEPYADGSDASSTFPNYVSGGDVLKSYLDTGVESPNWDGIGPGNKFAAAGIDPGALPEFSVEFWWFEDIYDSYDGMVGVSDGSLSSDGEMNIIRAADTGNAMRTQVRYNGGANTRTATFGNGTDAATGVWRHFAIVLDGGGHHMYDHGVLAQEFTSSTYQGGRADAPGTISAYTMVGFANAASIPGAGGIGGGSGFRGKIAGLKMWDKALTLSEISATVSAGPTLPGA